MPDQIDKGSDEKSEGPFEAGGQVRPDPLVEETKRMVENTNRFLNGVHESDASAQRYVKALKKKLEDNLLQLKHRPKETSPREE